MKKKYLIVSLLIFVSVLSCNFLEDAANNAGLTGNTTLDLPIS